MYSHFSLPRRLPEFTRDAASNCFLGGRLLLVFCLLALGLNSRADEVPAAESDLPADFAEVVTLEPFQVQGESLAISVFARSKADRAYARRFAESVVDIMYATMDDSLGRGLVIVGEKGEPHPVHVFHQFLEMVEQKKLTADFNQPATELRILMQEWEKEANMDDDSDGEGEINIEFEMVVNAIPLPLEGVGSRLYQIAWSEEFEENRIEQRLLTMTGPDLVDSELAHYDWVFYLPPRDAFKKVLKEVLPLAMKEAKMGFFQRAAARGAIALFKPLIRDAIEGARKGMLFMTVLRAVSDYEKEEIHALTGAYVEAMMPHGKIIPGQKRDRAIAAIEAQKLKNAEYAKDPFVSPDPLDKTEVDWAAYAKFAGEYAEKKKTTHRFAVKDQTCTWQYLDRDPAVFLPAGGGLLVSEDGTMTIEFLVNEAGAVTEVEERWVRRRKTVPRKS